MELIANPSRYNGQNIQTSGYMVLGPHDGAIYLSELDASNHVLENSLSIPLLDTATVRRFGKRPGYGTITGIFDRDQRGPEGVRSGAIMTR